MTVRIYIIIFLIFSVLAPNESLCNDNKKKDENPSFFQKVYHDMTTRFNYFFNARLKLNESLRQMQDTHQDNYDDLLSIRKYGNKEKRSSAAPQMDEVIKKSSIAIQIHKISKWVDDCYLLIAKANFLKGENDSSLEALEYIDTEFGNRIRNTDLITTKYDEELKQREDALPVDERDKTRKPSKNKPAKKDKSDIEKINKNKKQDKEREQKEKKDLAEKDRKAKDKERDKARKETAKERDNAKKEKDKAKKDREKERKKEAKEKSGAKKKKSAKDYNKDKAKAANDRKKSSAKDYNKAKKEAAKKRAKDAEARKKGNKKVDEVYEALENKDKEKEAEAKEKEKEALAKAQDKKNKAAAEERLKVEKEEQKLLEEAAKAEKESLEAAEKEEQEKLAEEEKLAKAEEKKSKKSKKDKKKDKDETDENEEPQFSNSGSASGFGHKRVNHESKLWKAENQIDLGNYESAKRILDEIGEKSGFPKKLRSDYYALRAMYYINNEMWNESIAALESAIEYTKKKPTKARYHFILAQISQQETQYSKATQSFKKVLKNKPIYDMEFNTRLKMAQTLMLSDPSAKGRAVKSLQKMLKDEKNEDYLDKIHFTLAEIELADGNIDLAIAQLKESAAKSTKDANQKGMSFLKLAEIYFDQQDYRNSGAYYDSAVLSISKDYPQYEEIVDRKEIMVELAGYLNTIYFEDSLQTLAKMDVAERNMIIDGVIENIVNQAKETLSEETEEGAVDFSELDKISGGKSNLPGGPPGMMSGNSNSSFYFYNPVSKSKGFNGFKKRWGNRKQGDWWAIASKASDDNSFATSATTNSLESEEKLKSLALEGGLKRDVFIAQLPMDDASLTASNERIIESMYQAGGLYKEALKKNDEAAKIFNDLLTKYNNNPYDLETNYQLYSIYTDQNNQTLANKHKNYILANYPESTYAQMIENPDYAKTAAQVDTQVNEFYEASYALYKKEAYDEVLARSASVDEMFTVNPLKSKFDFLSAQSIGHSKDEAAYIKALEEVSNNFPGTDVGIKSKEILDILKNGGVPENKGDNKKPTKEEGVYKTNLNSKHYFIIHFDFTNSDINKIKEEVSNFNTTFFSLDKFKVNDRLLRKTNHLIMVEDFQNAEDAMKYYTSFQNEVGSFFKTLKGVDYTNFVISRKNYQSFFKYKIVKDYLTYFEGAYLEGKE